MPSLRRLKHQKKTVKSRTATRIFAAKTAKNSFKRNMPTEGLTRVCESRPCKWLCVAAESATSATFWASIRAALSTNSAEPCPPRQNPILKAPSKKFKSTSFGRLLIVERSKNAGVGMRLTEKAAKYWLFISENAIKALVERSIERSSTSTSSSSARTTTMLIRKSYRSKNTSFQRSLPRISND